MRRDEDEFLSGKSFFILTDYLVKNHIYITRCKLCFKVSGLCLGSFDKVFKKFLKLDCLSFKCSEIFTVCRLIFGLLLEKFYVAYYRSKRSLDIMRDI